MTDLQFILRSQVVGRTDEIGSSDITISSIETKGADMKTQSASMSRILVVAVLLLSITCAVLVAVLIWRAFIYESDTTTPNENPMDLKLRFPGYFRTPQEQQEFEQIRISTRWLEPVLNVSTATNVCFEPCKTGYTGTTAAPVYPTPGGNSTNQAGRRRRKRQSGSTCALDGLRRQGVQLTYHVCCVSHATYDAYQVLPSAKNSTVMLQIAQGIGNLFQYFETEYCCQVSGCSVCQCEQTHFIVSAVIRDPKVPNHYYTDLVKAPGCCKCINRSSRK